MSNMEDVGKIAKELDKLAAGKPDSTRVNELFGQLEEHKITFSIIEKTRVGRSVNTARKAVDDPKVAAKGKALISKWKKLVPSPATPSDQKASAKAANGKVEKSTPKNGSSNGTPGAAPAPKKVLSKDGYTGDSTRDGSRKLLLQLFEGNEELAIACEQAIFDKNGGTASEKYKTQVREKYLNLKRNAELREAVMKSELMPEQLAGMTQEELATKDMKEKLDFLKEEAVRMAQTAKPSGTRTKQFQCGKCKHRDTTYFQMQTRSADEPMTTFVTCNNCQNSWKFC
eukprot:Clim_evm78s134 gene=Clim_evmTU78s134